MNIKANFAKDFGYICVIALILSGCRSRALDKGDICLKLGDYPMAIAFFSEEVKRHPDSFDARFGLGKALVQQGCANAADSGAWKNAIIQLDAASTLSPAAEVRPILSEAYLARAHMLLGVQDSVAALDALSRAIDCNASAIEPINLAGIIYFRIGEPDKAEALFSKALTLDSTSAAAHFNLGMVYWQAGRYPDAHEQWYAALAAAPKDKDILSWFALAEKKKREAAR
jgi:tetratricopeptide (TPR) repeat protein